MKNLARLFLLAILCVSLFTPSCCAASPAEVTGAPSSGQLQQAADRQRLSNTNVRLTKDVRVSQSEDWPVLPKRSIRSTPEKGEIFQLDRTALNGRKVLLFVHGGGAEKRPFFRWGKLVHALKADPEFSKRFKIYFYRYDSDARLAQTTPQLKEAILQLRQKAGVNQISLLCLSMGGNLAQRAMLDSAVESAVDLVFCLGTPFHGSPLFSSDWFKYSLNSQWYMPWARAVHNLDYLLYFSRHHSLQEDLKWDNFDQMIPDVGKFDSELGLGPKGELSPEDDANPELAAINESHRLNKSKFVAYGGYLVNIYLMHGKRKFFEETVLAPYHYLTVKLPVQLGREHPALRMLNMEMSNLAINPDAALYGPPSPHSYVLNDGITPISSSLFLPPELIRENPMLLEYELKSIRDASDVHLVRVFRDMDHISFLDGKPPRHFGRQEVSDQVHPEDGRQRLFQWIAHDLLQYVPDGKSAQSVPGSRAR